MKKIIAVFLGFVMTLSLAACGEASPDAPTDTNSTPQSTAGTEDGSSETPNVTHTNGKTLVVYFSGSGNTERVAGYIAQATGGDLFELTPITPYTDDDLDWTVAGSRVNREHDDEALRDIPLSATAPENFSEYGTIFIGYPIWWGIAAWPVNSFVKNNDFTDKTVIPFATSASSGMGQSGTLLRDMAGTGNWLEGQRFSSGANESTVSAWVRELNL